jgi:hypothetical protein
MEFVPGPGLWPDPGLALPEKSLQALYCSFTAELAGYEFLNAFSYDGIDGGLSLKSQTPGLFKEFFIDFQCNISHFGAPNKSFKYKIAQGLCFVKVRRREMPYPGSRGHARTIAAAKR